MSRTSSFRSKRLQSKRRKSLLYKYGLWVGIGAVIFLVIFFVSRAKIVQISNIEISGNEIVERADLESIINSELNSHFLWVFKKNNFVLFSRENVFQKIYDKSKAVSRIRISFPNLKTLSLEIEERHPDFLWCDSLLRQDCYFMDRTGYIFSPAPDFSKNVLFTYYGLIDPRGPITKTYVQPENFAELNKFVESLKLLNLNPVGLNARTGEDFEVLLSSGGSVLFSSREDFLITFENLETIIAEQTRLDKDFLKRLEYIDVRFPSKAFVKLR